MTDKQSVIPELSQSDTIEPSPVQIIDISASAVPATSDDSRSTPVLTVPATISAAGLRQALRQFDRGRLIVVIGGKGRQGSRLSRPPRLGQEQQREGLSSPEAVWCFYSRCVGTVTEIYDYLRLLFARVGTPYSPATGRPIEAMQVQDMVDAVMAMPEGTRGYLMAPIVRDRKGEYRKEFLQLQEASTSASRWTVSSTKRRSLQRSTSSATTSTSWWTASSCARGLETRLADSFRTALNLADGIAILETAPADGEPEPDYLQRKFRLPGLGLYHPESSRELFSFNAPFGACRPATGSGWSFSSTSASLPDVTLKLKDGALAPLEQVEVALFPPFSLNVI